MAVSYVPEGLHTVTPYITIQNVAKLIDFLTKVFGAEERERMTRPDGSIMHAEVRIGDSLIMMGEPQAGLQAMPCALYVYVPDTDAAYRCALDAGAVSLMEPADQFYGDRNAGVKDQLGNVWWIGTHQEDVAPDEIARRAEAAMQRRKGA